MGSLFYRAIVRTMPDSVLIGASLWNPSDGEPVNMEAEELDRRWSMSATPPAAEGEKS